MKASTNTATATEQEEAPTPSSEASSNPSPGDHDADAVAKLAAELVGVDDGALKQLLRDCRRVRVDASVEEILYFATNKLMAAHRNKKITNPVGLMLSSVPQCFQGESFAVVRKQLNDEKEAERIAKERAEQQAEDTERWVRQKISKLEGREQDSSLSQADRDKATAELLSYRAVVAQTFPAKHPL